MVPIRAEFSACMICVCMFACVAEANIRYLPHSLHLVCTGR